MPLDFPAARQRVRQFDFTCLFIEDLGWDNCQQSFAVPVADRVFQLAAVAKKCGMVAYACSPADGGGLPDRALRLAIDRAVTQVTYEHLLIFMDPARTTQVWQWVRREPGKPLACREHTYQTTQPGDSLLQKLLQLAVSLEEEEHGIALPDITGRVRAAFDVERVTKRFYDQFRKEKDTFTKFIEGIPVAEDCHWYASVILNRLMFVYFIQRKGFLDGDPNYMRNRLQQMKREHGQDKFYTFYRYFLLRLFHEGLSGHRIAKFGTPTEVAIWKKVESARTSLAALTTASSEHVFYYQEACRYWAKACKGYPYFRRNGEKMPPPHGRIVSFDSAQACAFAACLVNSSLFYWFYSAFSDCEHINDALIRGLKIPDPWARDDWKAVEHRLAQSLKANAERKTISTKQGHEIEYDELNASKSKPILDEIDTVLARHYGFTEEELDFILNYDIKYRLGRDTETDNE